MCSFKYVVENSKFVKVNQKQLSKFIAELGTPQYQHWSKEINLNIDEDKLVLLAFLIESMNFCFWRKPKWKINYNGEILSGSNALFFSIIREIEKNPKFLDINYLYKLTKDDLLEIFESFEGKVPLLNDRYNCFKETISFIYKNKNFYKDIYSIKTDQDMLEYITKNISCFDDKSLYKGKIIEFNKRATLLVNDLFYLSKSIKTNLGNVNNLSGCADYGIPRTFRDYGILEYSSELSNIIDNEEQILHDSEMEIEIRANMLYVIELIKDEMRNKNIFINSVELDNLIWLMGKKNKNKKSNAHHTVTIFY